MTAITPKPASATEERLDAAAADRLARVPAELPGTAWDPDNIPEEYLPVLAWAHSVDGWSPAWTVAEKRAAIKGAVEAHSRKGTEAGVRGVLERIGAEYTYAERINNKPFTARVVVLNSNALRKSDALSLESLVNAHKRGTVHMTIESQASLAGGIFVASGLGAVVLGRLDLDGGL